MDDAPASPGEQSTTSVGSWVAGGSDARITSATRDAGILSALARDPPLPSCFLLLVLHLLGFSLLWMFSLYALIRLCFSLLLHDPFLPFTHHPSHHHIRIYPVPSRRISWQFLFLFHGEKTRSDCRSQRYLPCACVCPVPPPSRRPACAGLAPMYANSLQRAAVPASYRRAKLPDVPFAFSVPLLWLYRRHSDAADGRLPGDDQVPRPRWCVVGFTLSWLVILHRFFRLMSDPLSWLGCSLRPSSSSGAWWSLVHWQSRQPRQPKWCRGMYRQGRGVACPPPCLHACHDVAAGDSSSIPRGVSPGPCGVAPLLRRYGAVHRRTSRILKSAERKGFARSPVILPLSHFPHLHPHPRHPPLVMPFALRSSPSCMSGELDKGERHRGPTPMSFGRRSPIKTVEGAIQVERCVPGSMISRADVATGAFGGGARGSMSEPLQRMRIPCKDLVSCGRQRL